MVLLKNRRAIMAAIASMFAMIFLLFFDSILAVQLKSHMNINENTIGNCF